MTMQLMLPSEALNRRFELPDINTLPTAGLHTEKTVFERHCFTVGEVGLLLPEDTVSEVFDELPHSRIPNAPKALESMANVRGDMVPVFNLHQLLELEENESADYKILVVGQKEMAIGLRVDNLPRRVSLTQEYKLKSELTLPNKLTPFARECYQYKNQLWVDWDIYGFFSAISHSMH